MTPADSIVDPVLVLLVVGVIVAAYLVGHRHGYRDAMEDFR